MNGPWLFLAAYACSGFAGLIYEVAWVRTLTLYMGHTTAATSTVVAAFMGGMAAGSAIGGRVAARLPAHRALVGYAILESIVILLAIALPLELRALTPVLRWAYRDGAARQPVSGRPSPISLAVLMVPDDGARRDVSVCGAVVLSRSATAHGRSPWAGCTPRTPRARRLACVVGGFAVDPGHRGDRHDPRRRCCERPGDRCGADHRASRPRRARGRRGSQAAWTSRPTQAQCSTRRKQGCKLNIRRSAGSLAAGWRAWCSHPRDSRRFSTRSRGRGCFRHSSGRPPTPLSRPSPVSSRGLAIGSALGSVLTGRTRRPELPLALALLVAAIAASWASAYVDDMPLRDRRAVRALAAGLRAAALHEFRAGCGAGRTDRHRARRRLSAGVGDCRRAPGPAEDHSSERWSERLGMVYAINTVASVGGSLAAGFLRASNPRIPEHAPPGRCHFDWRRASIVVAAGRAVHARTPRRVGVVSRRGWRDPLELAVGSRAAGERRLQVRTRCSEEPRPCHGVEGRDAAVLPRRSDGHRDGQAADRQSVPGDRRQSRCVDQRRHADAEDARASAAPAARTRANGQHHRTGQRRHAGVGARASDRRRRRRRDFTGGRRSVAVFFDRESSCARRSAGRD